MKHKVLVNSHKYNKNKNISFNEVFVITHKLLYMALWFPEFMTTTTLVNLKVLAQK